MNNPAKVVICRPHFNENCTGIEVCYEKDAAGSVIVFDSENQARVYLSLRGHNKVDQEYFWFRRSIGTCRRCGSPLFESDISGYESQCFTCDEDFYSFEKTVAQFENLMSEATGIDRKILFGESGREAHDEEG